MATKKRKRTPEAEEAYRKFRQDSDQRMVRLRQLYEKGMAELDARRAQERRESS